MQTGAGWPTASRSASTRSSSSGSAHSENGVARWLRDGAKRNRSRRTPAFGRKSACPPHPVTISPSPAASASAAGRFSPSPRLGSTITSASRYSASTSAAGRSASINSTGASPGSAARSRARSAATVLCGLGKPLITSRTPSPARNARAQAASSTSTPLRGKPDETCRKVRGCPVRGARTARNASSGGQNGTTRTGTRTPESISARATVRPGASTPAKPVFSAATMAAGARLSSQNTIASARSPGSGGTQTGQCWLITTCGPVAGAGRASSRPTAARSSARFSAGTRSTCVVTSPSTGSSRTVPGRSASSCSARLRLTAARL